MKVIDIEPYLKARKISQLEERIAKLCLDDKPGCVREMKLCFKQWLKISHSITL